MLAHLAYFLFFETVQPSYGTFTGFLPEQVILEANHQTQTLLMRASAGASPIKKGDSLGPVIEAPAVYAMDIATGTPLFVKNVFERRPLASIAKIVTAMVILDNHSPSEKFFVTKNASSQEGSEAGLRTAEEITVGEALKGLLIPSGNDAAVALAEFDAGSEAAFVVKMNAKVVSLGLYDTHFSNAKGFDERQNYSTAFDVMMFAKAALNYSFIREIVSIKETDIQSADGKISHHIESTNELLDNPHFKVLGLKTGKTPLAGESLVSLSILEGREVLTVVMGSNNRFKETKILLDWIIRNFTL